MMLRHLSGQSLDIPVVVRSSSTHTLNLFLLSLHLNKPPVLCRELATSSPSLNVQLIINALADKAKPTGMDLNKNTEDRTLKLSRAYPRTIPTAREGF